MKSALVFDQVTKSYGSRRALDSLSFAIPAGSLCGLIGSNGAGKTTALSLAAGLLSPDHGQLDVLENGPFDPDRHAGKVSLLPQDSQLPPEATVWELLRLYALLQNVPQHKVDATVRHAIQTVHLDDRLHSPIRTLSHGMRRRVMIAQAFLGNPTLVLLDEPLNGLDPREAASTRELFASWKGRATLVISSHVLSELERLCDFLVIIENGRTLHQGPLSDWLGRGALLLYALDGTPFDLESLQSEAPDIAMTLSADRRLLKCRYNATRLDAAALNRLILQRLLQAGVGIHAVQPGDTLESSYLAAVPSNTPNPVSS